MSRPTGFAQPVKLALSAARASRGHARGRRGLELLSHGSARSMRPRRLPEPPFRRIASPLMQPSPIGRRVGIRIVTFEDLVITQVIPELARRTSAGSESH